MRGKIDTNYGWLSVAKTRPVSYEWSDHNQTALALMVKPLKTSLALLVIRMTFWMTMFSRLAIVPIVQSSVVAYNPLINREGRVSCLEMFCLWRLGLWSLSLHSICRIPLMTYFYPSIIGGAS